MGDEVLKQTGRFSDWIGDAIQTLYPLAKENQESLDALFLLAVCARAYVGVVRAEREREIAMEQLDGIEYQIGQSRNDGGEHIRYQLRKLGGLPEEDEGEDDRDDRDD